MLETLDASGLVAHAIGPGDRFYIALRKVRLIRQAQSVGRRRRQLFATTRALRKRTGSLKILRDSQVRLQEGMIVEHNRTSGALEAVLRLGDYWLADNIEQKPATCS
jgi:hypothetical protein